MKLKINDNLFNKEELMNTPQRYERFMNEWQCKTNDFNFTMFKNPGIKGMIIMKNISFSSMCSHHLLPFSGLAHVGYISSEKVCGASKLIRTVEKFACKPQMQEKLTAEVADYLSKKLNPLGVAVVIEASHDCMKIRGVKNPTAIMVTSELRGIFDKNPATRDEFFRLIGK